MVGGELMEVVPFLERMQQKLTALLATVLGGLLNPLWLLVWQDECLFRSIKDYKLPCYDGDHYLQQIAYAIGIAQPLAMYIDSYGTSNKTNDELCEIVKKNFDLRPGKIIE